MKPTELIVCANGEDIIAYRQKLIDKYEGTSKFVKWSDTSLELKNKLFVFKVVNVPTSILDSLRGYDKVQLNHLEAQISNLVEEVASLTEEKPEEAPNAPQETTEAPEGGDTSNVNNDDSRWGQKNEDKED